MDPFDLANGEERVFDALEPGAVTVTETDLPAGWELDDIVCSGATITDEDVAAGFVILDLAFGDDAVRELEIPPATLTMVKDGRSASSDARSRPSLFDISGTGLVNSRPAG